MDDWFEELEKERTRNKIYAGQVLTPADIDKEREEVLKYNFKDKFMLKDVNNAGMIEVLKQTIPLFCLAFVCLGAIIIFI